MWGANETPPAAGSNTRAWKPRGYNANYLKPDPATAWRVPMPKPGGFKSVAHTFSGSDAAFAEVDAAIPPSAYNANYLRTASKRRYPTIHGPITDNQAFAILRGASDEETKVARAPVGTSVGLTSVGPTHYAPMAVLETLKLLSKGDISDEQLEVYEEDGNRIRTYAAVARQRALTSEEQDMVDEIGARLAEEARKLVEEDVLSAQSKRGELEALAAVPKNLQHEQTVAVATAAAEEQKRVDAAAEAKNAEADVINYQTISSTCDAPILLLEDELKRGLPGTPGKNKAKVRLRKETELQKLKDEKLDLDNLALAATVAQSNFERLHDDAALARDAAAATATARGADIIPAMDALNLARDTKREVNARFAPKISKAGKQAQLTAAAVQISQAPPAPADAKYDAEFSTMSTKGGPVEEFIKFNLGRDTSKKKFHSNGRLMLEWVEFARKYPKLGLPSSPPWILEKGRQKTLHAVFESDSSIVPSEFKVELLRRAGY